jgi:hypothetical protein
MDATQTARYAFCNRRRSKAAQKAEKYLKRLGMRWTVSYELVQTGLDDFFNS